MGNKYKKYVTKKFIEYIKKIEANNESDFCFNCPLRGLNKSRPNYRIVRTGDFPGDLMQFIPQELEKEIKTLSVSHCGSRPSNCFISYAFLFLLAGYNFEEGVRKYNYNDYSSARCSIMHKKWGELKKELLHSLSSKEKLDIS